jgi:hypothetical protein
MTCDPAPGSELTRLPAAPSVPWMAGGGGTTCPPAPGDEPSPKRLSILCIQPCRVGGGATTVAPGAERARWAETVPTSGAGATTVACGSPGVCLRARPRSGGGATTEVQSAGRFRRARPVAAKGTAGAGPPFAARLGAGVRPFRFTSGAVGFSTLRRCSRATASAFWRAGFAGSAWCGWPRSSGGAERAAG